MFSGKISEISNKKKASSPLHQQQLVLRESTARHAADSQLWLLAFGFQQRQLSAGSLAHLMT
jgi:hypothetical protein